MENKFLIVILGMTAFLGLIAIGYLIYLILKIAIFGEKGKSASQLSMSPLDRQLDNNEFQDMCEFDDATVLLCGPMRENYSLVKLQFTMIAGEPSERTEFLHKGIIVIGRALDADISIDDRAVSRHHLELSFLNGELQIQALNTTNGTILNGEEITPLSLVPISSKSIVNIGRTSFAITPE